MAIKVERYTDINYAWQDDVIVGYLKELLKKVSPTESKSMALGSSLINFKKKSIRLLLDDGRVVVSDNMIGYVADYCDVEVVRWILAYEKDIDVTMNGGYPLLVAISKNKWDVVEELLKVPNIDPSKLSDKLLEDKKFMDLLRSIRYKKLGRFKDFLDL